MYIDIINREQSILLILGAVFISFIRNHAEKTKKKGIIKFLVWQTTIITSETSKRIFAHKFLYFMFKLVTKFVILIIVE